LIAGGSITGINTKFIPNGTGAVMGAGSLQPNMQTSREKKEKTKQKKATQN